MLIKEAEISSDGIYRYWLSRIWFPHKPYVCFVGLNPSIADADIDDPTIKKCVRYSLLWHYGGLVMVNLFAYRATKPRKMMTATSPVGPLNDEFIKRFSKDAGLTIMAWGNNGSHKNRNSEVIPLLTEPYYLVLTNKEHPHHPLFLKYDMEPKIWTKK